MTCRLVPSVAVVGVVLAAAVSGCALTSGQTAPATVPANLPAADTGATTPGPTVTARPFTPTPLPTGRNGIPAGGLPPTSTLSSPDPDVVAAAALTAYNRADTALDLGPADTHRRALPWTTGQLATGIRDDRRVTAPGATWTALAVHRGYTAATPPSPSPAPTTTAPPPKPDDQVPAVHCHRDVPRAGRLERPSRYAHRVSYFD